MSDSATPSPNAPEAQKTRSPVERALVWGLILVLVLVVLFEFKAKRNFDNSLNALNEAFQDADQNNKFLTASQVDEIVSGHSSVNTDKLGANRFLADRQDTYTFKGLIKTHTIYIAYANAGREDNAEPYVLQVDVTPVSVAADAVMVRDRVGDGRVSKPGDANDEAPKDEAPKDDSDEGNAGSTTE